MDKQVIAIDFDGTITETDNYPIIGKIKPHCVETIKYLSQYYCIVLNTCREGTLLEQAKQFLKDNDIYNCFTSFNENPQYRIEKYKNDCRKIGANFYIDDKNVLSSVDWVLIDTYFRGLNN